jgi:hypothetical protein
MADLRVAEDVASGERALIARPRTEADLSEVGQSVVARADLRQAVRALDGARFTRADPGFGAAVEPFVGPVAR